MEKIGNNFGLPISCCIPPFLALQPRANGQPIPPSPNSCSQMEAVKMPFPHQCGSIAPQLRFLRPNLYHISGWRSCVAAPTHNRFISRQRDNAVKDSEQSAYHVGPGPATHMALEMKKGRDIFSLSWGESESHMDRIKVCQLSQ